MAAPGMPHYVPGMGFKKLPPGAIRTMSGPESVACRTKCGEVELKITLSAKLLAKPLRAALIEPFLKVHNKRAAAPVAWEDIKCIKVDGYTLDVPAVYSDVGDAGTGTGEEGTSPPPPPSASTFLTKEELKVELVSWQLFWDVDSRAESVSSFGHSVFLCQIPARKDQRCKNIGNRLR